MSFNRQQIRLPGTTVAEVRAKFGPRSKQWRMFDQILWHFSRQLAVTHRSIGRPCTLEKMRDHVDDLWARGLLVVVYLWKCEAFVLAAWDAEEQRYIFPNCGACDFEHDPREDEGEEWKRGKP